MSLKTTHGCPLLLRHLSEPPQADREILVCLFAHMTHIVAVSHDHILLPGTRAQDQCVERGELLPRHNGLGLVARVFLVFALYSSILTFVFADDVNAYIHSAKPETAKYIVWHVF